MEDIYEANPPTHFPSPKEQLDLVAESAAEEQKIPEAKDAMGRWKNEVLDKIRYLKETLEQANQDKEALYREIDSLKAELSASEKQIQQLKNDLSATLEAFNNTLRDISEAL